MTVTLTEVLHQGFAQQFQVSGPMLVDERSQFQHIQLFDTLANGRMMTLDGVVQITDRDEDSYSEMLAHVPMVELGDVSRVLIIGGGDGAVAEEALKHPGVAVEMCEIDGRVVEVCKEHFAHVNRGAFDDPRFTLHLRDAFEYLKEPEVKGRFDVIIADRPDPIGPGKVLFQTSFYELVRDALSERGVVVFQNGAPFYQPNELRETMAQLRAVFAQSGCYVTATPTYIGGFMALTWASKGSVLNALDDATLQQRLNDLKLPTTYYNKAIHRGAFALPQWIAELVNI